MDGKDVRELRESLGMSQLEFARLLGYDNVKTVLRWENDQCGIPNTSRVVLFMLKHEPLKMLPLLRSFKHILYS